MAADKTEDAKKEILKDLVTSLVWTAALTLFFAVVLEGIHPEWGEQLKAAAYAHLSSRLAQRPDGEDIPVSVVDISASPPKQINRPGGVVSVTPREGIRKFLQTVITDPETRPRAVGIDVDFSPDAIGLSDPDDPAFFAFCQQMGRDYHVPIFLGVKRAVAAGPDGWLGLPEYSGLAADIGVPRGDKIYLPARIGLGGSDSAAPSSAALPSMGVALGWVSVGSPPPRLAGLVHVFSDDPELGDNRQTRDKISGRRFLVDYSLAKDLQNRARPLKDFAPPFSDREKEYLFRKIVLLGNDSPSGQDIQLLPDGRQAPGVYLHGCAAATLAGGPLYEFGFWVSLGLDVLLAVSLIGGYALVRLWLHRRGKVLKLEMKALFALLAALVVWGAVRLALGEFPGLHGVHIMWLDFILIAGAYLLHSPVEEFCNARVKAWKQALIADAPKTAEKASEEVTEKGTEPEP